MTVLDLSEQNLLRRREVVEDEVRRHVKTFEDKLADIQKELEVFKKKVCKTLING